MSTVSLRPPPLPVEVADVTLVCITVDVGDVSGVTWTATSWPALDGGLGADARSPLAAGPDTFVDAPPAPPPLLFDPNSPLPPALFIISKLDKAEETCKRFSINSE